MKKILIISLLLIATMALFADSAVAFLAANRGRVELARNNRNLRFRAGEMLQNNDQIKTGNESYAAYKYVDGSSQVRVFANSIVRVRATTTNGTLNKTVAIDRGNVYSRVTRNTGSYRVETSNTVASVRGTGFLTKVDDEGYCRYIVEDGEIELLIRSTGERHLVGRGKTASIDPDGNVNIADSSADDLTELDNAEEQAGQEANIRTIRIPVQNETGEIKYIEIQY